MKNKIHVITCLVIFICVGYSIAAYYNKNVLMIGTYIAMVSFLLFASSIAVFMLSVMYGLLYNFIAKELKAEPLKRNVVLDFLFKFYK